MSEARDDRLRLARLAWRMTQKELAEQVGVSRQTINLMERGRYNPSLRLCISICRTLGRSLDQLFWKEAQ